MKNRVGLSFFPSQVCGALGAYEVIILFKLCDSGQLYFFTNFSVCFCKDQILYTVLWLNTVYKEICIGPLQHIFNIFSVLALCNI